jgi:hypothetical protein
MSDVILNFRAAGLEELASDTAKASQELTELNTAQKAVEASAKTSRTRLMEMREELIRMAEAGKLNTQEYKKLEAAAGKLDDTIKDVRSSLANAGSDTRGLDTALRAVTTLSAGFQTVQGAAALFGDESEDLQKALLKVNAIMALTNGLQQIHAEYMKDDSIFTRAATKAKELYARVTGTATVATKALTAALSVGLIGILVLLVTNWDKIVGAINRFVDATYTARKAAEDLAKAHAKENDELEYQLKLMKARGVEDEKQLVLTNNTRARQLDQLKAQLATQKALLETEKNRAAVGSERQGFISGSDAATVNAYEKQIKKTEESIKAARLAFLEANKALKDYGNSQNVAGEATTKTTAAIQAQTKALEDSTEPQREQSSRRQKENELESKGIEEIGDKRANVNNETIDASVKRKEAEVKANNEIAASDNATYNGRISLAQKAFDYAARFEQGLGQIVTNSFAIQQQELEQKRAAGLITEKQYAKEIAKLQQKQLKASKATGIVEATINGAVAALKAFAELGPIGGAIAAVVIAGITATQIALIAKQKIPNVPGFFRGTKDAPPGMKWVGEKGPELVNDKGGYAIIPAGESQRIASMYKKWSVPTITLPEITRNRTAYQPVTGDRLRSQDKGYGDLLQKVERLTQEVQFGNQYIKQGNNIAAGSNQHLRDIKTVKRGIYT